MVRAKFRLDFELETTFNIDEIMEVPLPDGSRIILNNRGKNWGFIFLELDKPDEGIAENKGWQIMQDFFTHLLIIKDDFENMKPIKILSLNLLNPEDFKQVTRVKHITTNATIYTQLEQKELIDTSNLIAKIEKLSEKEKRIINRSLRWFRKASKTKGEDRFVFRWISFEALLGLLEKEKATHNLIPEFIDKLKKETSYRIFKKHEKTIKDLSATNLISFGEDKNNYSGDLRNFLEGNKHPRAILQQVVLCIYEVRNRFFHKGESLLIDGSSLLLRDLIRESLKTYVK